jgi:invasion protein IalB
MTSWNAAAPKSPVSRTLAGIVLAAALSIALAVAVNPRVFAQAPAPAPAAKAKAPAKKAAPAAATDAPQPAPTPAPAPAAQGQGQTQGGEQHVELIYSPWTKFCLKGQETPTPKEVCFTGKDARIESGMPVVAAVLIEPQGETKKILRVTLPLGMQLVHGTRVIVDQDQPLTAPYVICFTNG